MTTPTYPCADRIRRARRCTRPALWVDSYRQAEHLRRLEAADSNAGDTAVDALVCGIHKVSRAHWSPKDRVFIPISDPSVQPLLEAALKHLKEADDEARTERDARVAQNHAAYAQRVDREWQQLVDEQPWQARYVERLERSAILGRTTTDRLWAVEQVLPLPSDVDEEALAYGALHPDEYVEVSVKDRDDDVIEPLRIRFAVRQPMTAKEARAFAESLVEAAKVADAGNRARLAAHRARAH